MTCVQVKFICESPGIKFMQGQKLEDMHKYCTASAEAQPIQCPCRWLSSWL